MRLTSRREIFQRNARDLVSRLEEGKTRGFVGKRILQDLRSLLTLVAVDEKIIDQAFASDIRDFEDAVQYFAAASKRIDVIITRNKKDFPKGDIVLLTCEEYLAQVAR